MKHSHYCLLSYSQYIEVSNPRRACALFAITFLNTIASLSASLHGIMVRTDVTTRAPRSVSLESHVRFGGHYLLFRCCIMVQLELMHVIAGYQEDIQLITGLPSV